MMPLAWSNIAGAATAGLLAAALVAVAAVATAVDRDEAVDDFLRELSEESETMVDPDTEHEAERHAATFPCNILDAEELLGWMGGVAMDGGAYSSVQRSEGSRSWMSAHCRWSAMSGGEARAELWLSQAKHFESGAVECHPPLAEADELPGIGSKAWWIFARGSGRGTLRVCAGVALVEAVVTRPGAEELQLRQAARAIAQHAIAAVAGVGKP